MVIFFFFFKYISIALLASLRIDASETNALDGVKIVKWIACYN